MKLKNALSIGASVATLAFATPALADPISTAIVAAIGLTGTAAVIATAVLTFTMTAAASLLVSKVFKPDAPSQNMQERQASILQTQIGEGPCEAAFGTVSSGGQLVDIFNWGADYEHEVTVLAIASHEVEQIIGFYINDEFYDWEVGAHSKFKNKEGAACLLCYEFFGTSGAAPHSHLTNSAPDRWKTNDKAVDRHIVIFDYFFDDEIWQGSRPRFQVVFKGGRWYDPSKDSTVAGGSGPQRWADRTTWAYTENAKVAEYNYQRGIWSTNGQLLIGPGRSAEEMPPEEAVPLIAICNESVGLKAGGTEARYRVGCIVRSNEIWIENIKRFARAMGGEVVDRNGSVYAEPGYAKTSDHSFTDLDIVTGREMQYEPKRSGEDLVNTVVGRFVNPDNLWDVSPTPVRRSLADITADGAPKELTLDLDFVTSPTQAQRLCEIERRKQRLQRSAAFDLPHPYMEMQAGDWADWTSDRRFGGLTRTFYVAFAQLDDAGNTRAALKEIDADVFDWDAATDELDEERPVYLPQGALNPPTIYGFNAVMVPAVGAAGTRPVAMQCTWSKITDKSIHAIRIEYRVKSSMVDLDVVEPDQTKTQKVISSVVDGVTYEARAFPLTYNNNGVPTAWRDVEPLNLRPLNPPAPLTFEAWQDGEGVRFKVTKAGWPLPMETEIRGGQFWATGRKFTAFAGNDAGPFRDPPPADGSNRFWAFTFVRDAAGLPVYSATGRFFDLDVAAQPNKNEVKTVDFKTDDWPGVALGLTRAGVSGNQNLSLDAPGGVRREFGDYFQTVDLEDFYPNARWFFVELLAGRDPAPGIVYDDLTAVYDDLASWYPYATVEPVSEVDLTPYISTDSPPATFLDGVRLHGANDPTSVEGVDANIAGVTFDSGLRENAFVVSQSSTLNWPIAIPSTFRLQVDYQPDTGIDWNQTRVLVELLRANGDTLQIVFEPSDNTLRAVDTDGGVVSVAAPDFAGGEPSTIVISQGAVNRQIAWANPLTEDAATHATAAVAPIGDFESVSLASASGLVYDELTMTYNDLAAYTYDELGGTNNVAGRFSDLAIYTDELTAELLTESRYHGPAGFSDYREFIAANYSCAEASVWLRVQVAPGYGEPVAIEKAVVRADMKDVFDGGTANILAAGTRINFSETFTVAPTQRNVTQISGAQNVARFAITIDRFGFDIIGYNSSGVAIDCGISWAVRGR